MYFKQNLNWINITLLIQLLLLCFGSDKFGERTNIPKHSENTIWELTVQLLEMCNLNIIKHIFQDVSNSDFGPIL